MHWVVKLSKHGGQYRITLPGRLIEESGLEDVEYVRLECFPQKRILIEEYYGKGKEKRGIPEDQS